MSSEIIIVIITAVITIVVFIVFREFFTWYWKINQIVKNQEIQTELLRTILINAGGNVEKQHEIIPESKLKGMLKAGMITDSEFKEYMKSSK